MSGGGAEAVPYCGPAPSSDDWLATWNFDPLLIAALALGVVWSARSSREVRAARLGSTALVALLYISPLCVLGSALFSARVVHHLVLAVALAPLLVFALKLKERRLPASLALITALQALVFWAWHAPPLYRLALSNDAVFWLMQVSLTATAAIWWAKLRQVPSAAAVAALLGTMVQMGLLGALITFSGRPLYAPHWLSTQAWGLTPLEDQQIAGLVMWAPASAIYLLAALSILDRSLAPAELART